MKHTPNYLLDMWHTIFFLFDYLLEISVCYNNMMNVFTMWWYFPRHHIHHKTTSQQSNTSSLTWINWAWLVCLLDFFSCSFFQIFNKQSVHLCMCRWRVHLPICQDPPGAQADGVRQGHPPTEREPKRQSRHTLRQWRWYQVSPADGYKNTPLKMGKQKRPKTTSQGEEKKYCGDTLFLPQPQHCVSNIETKSKCVPTPDADLIHDKHLFALLLQAAPPCG